MKRLATRIIAVLLTFICMSADATAKDVEICLNLDGDKKIFVKDSRHLSLKIKGDKLTIYCDGKETAIYDSGDIHKITFEQNSGIHDLKGDDSDSGMLTRDGATGIRLSGFIAGTQVGIYTIGGLCVRNLSIPDDNSDISIDLEGLNPGIYIVTAGNSSFKISMYQ
mgnify:FL=1